MFPLKCKIKTVSIIISYVLIRGEEIFKNNRQDTLLIKIILFYKFHSSQVLI